MRTFYILLGIVAVLAIVAVAVMIVGPTLQRDATVGDGVVITDEAEVNAHALAFVQPAYRDDYGNVRLAGYVDNLGGATLIAANIEIELRNESGDRTALVAHSVTSIPPGQRKWFDIDQGTWTGPQQSTIKVTSIEVAR